MLSSLTIVIPFYNEADRLTETVADILLKCKIFAEDFEIILINDGSIDNSARLVNERFAESLKSRSLVLVDLAHAGKGSAVRAGLNLAKKDWVIFMDADNSAGIDSIKFLMPFVNEFPIIIGSRAIKTGEAASEDSIQRRIVGQVFNSVVRIILGLDFRDTQCGFKMFKREACQLLFQKMQEKGFAFDVELLYLAKKMSIQVKEVAINWKRSERSSVSIFKDAMDMFKAILRIRKIIL